MKDIINIIEMIVAVLLILFILLQKQEGGGLSSSLLGGDSGAYHTKRGLEKILLWGTIILAIIFIILAVAIRVMFS